jgi:hypothetical protein
MNEFSDGYIDVEFRIEIRRRSEWIENWYGSRCTTTEPGCPICQMWEQHDLFVKTINGEEQ